MAILIEKFNINSFGFDDVVDIMPKVNRIFLNSDIKTGLVNIYSKSKTSSIFVGKSDDFFKLNNLLDETIKNTDKNINADFYTLILKFKSNFFKNSIMLPIENSKILIDNNESIYFVDFENERKTKEVIVSITY